MQQWYKSISLHAVSLPTAVSLLFNTHPYTSACCYRLSIPLILLAHYIFSALSHHSQGAASSATEFRAGKLGKEGFRIFRIQGFFNA